MSERRVLVHVASPAQWREVRALRLAALADSPDGFAATLEHEGQQPDEFWQERLQRPSVATLVASTAAPADRAGVGLAVVAPWPGDAASAGLFAVWVAPQARGRGVGDALMRAAIEEATARGYARLVLDVGDDNGPAIRLYERFGFVRTGNTSTLPEPRSHVREHERARRLR
jgi:ribosomal protein S18 acetylase RimI-like enzyme